MPGQTPKTLSGFFIAKKEPAMKYAVVITIVAMLAVWAISSIGSGDSVLDGIKPSSKNITVEKDLGHFDSVRIKGEHLTVLEGDVEGPVLITGDSGLMENLKVYVDGATLTITMERGFRFRPGKRFEIMIPGKNVKDVRVSGANVIELNNIDREHMSIRGSGSTRIEANGTVGNVDIRMSGSSRFNGRELFAENADIRNSGSSRSSVNVSGNANGRASGASRIDVHGNPSDLVSRTSGSARITSHN